MNKKILLFIIFSIISITPTYAKTSTNKTESINYNSLYPFISMYSILGGISTLPGGGSPKISASTSWLIISIRVPIGLPTVYMYAQFRASFYMNNTSPLTSSVSPIVHMESTKIGAGLGFGGIVGDWRKNNSGWHITVQGGMVFEEAVPTHLELSSTVHRTRIFDRLIGFGPEISVISYYSINKNLAFNFGFHIGYRFNPFSGDSFYIGSSDGKTYFHTLDYGVSFGIAI